MTMTKAKKTEIISKFRKSAKDTGTPAVQVALLTERIKTISDHLKGARKDYSSQLGLLKLVSARKQFLAYLKRNDLAEYGKLIKQLDLRK